ncbi:alpha/beta fold hydrolase [Kitasatospora sp. NPDC018619]|uniref:alpha/beta fold hydrolase n=1 Tax=unclassified Kitasatospora TaxID=2633591 RepID=UPI00379A45B2
MGASQGGPGRAAGPALRSVQQAVARALGEHLPGGSPDTGELDRGGRALRWVAAGRGGVAPVVLIAGCGTTVLGWSAVLPELARYGRVVAYDRAGLGASDPGRAAAPTLDGQLADLAALVRYLDAGPALLVGHSWGGQLAQLLAWQRPELVAGLVLVDPAHEEFQPRAVRGAEAVLNRLWLYRVALRQSGPPPREFSRKALSLTAPEAATPADRVEAAEAAEVAEAAVTAYRHQRRSILAEQRLTAAAAPEIRRRRAAAPPLAAPLAVLSATRGLPRAMRAHWTALQAGVARNALRGTHGAVHGTGHAIQADQPQAVVAAVREVAERVRYFGAN